MTPAMKAGVDNRKWEIVDIVNIIDQYQKISTDTLPCFAIAMLTVTAKAADVTGRWSGQVPSRGAAIAATFTFKVDGDKLTGTITGPQGEVALQEGKVSGDQISFTTTGGDGFCSMERSLEMRSG
jgi:hypothetical protein